MKRICIASGLIGSLLSASSVVHAQSSVTMYGVLDESIQYTRNVDGHTSQLALYAGQLTTDRWGVKGSEDLGNGVKAIFRLENIFNLNNGAAQRMWGKSWVGLSSDTYGTVTVGRQLDPLSDLVMEVQGNNFLEYFTAPGDVDNGDATVYTNSAIKWASPSWGGLRTSVMYSVGGVAGSTGSGQTYSAAVNYSLKPIAIAAGYFHIDNGNPATSARGTSTAGTIFNSPVNAAYASARSINILRTGVTYAPGHWTFGLNYSHSEYIGDASSTFSRNEYYDSAAAFAAWNVTPSLLLEGGYVYLKSHGDSSATYHQASLAADYSLSKRTDLYAIAGYVHASGNNGVGPAQAVIADSFAPAGSSSQQIAIVGVRHRF
ncbi:porin [Burkholderia sp. MSh2]|uniref:Porin n=1 Tax=Burkholderia paludis TaxID=1506587 RepID=A0A6P2L368_9BURK|nr:MULTISPECIES: porin [Burkholderia]KEZ04094.1 porin [Burkholderia sp. MSh2]CAB3753101.1 Outer membrane porin protein [Burkholderia paludis]VWB65429.1 porin [Burkholderia paludis]